MQKYLGIDVGGTNIKCGVINQSGEILHQIKHHTPTLRQSESFLNGLMAIIGSLLQDFPDITHVGLGLPGTLNKTRTHTIELPNIPELNDCPLYEQLKHHFPSHAFVLENDANAAALGELYFSGKEMPADFLFVTLGTGVGGAAIIDNLIFKGGDGNSMEIGHMMSEGGQRLEQLIGKSGIIQMAMDGINKLGNQTILSNMLPITTKALVDAAALNDACALQIFQRMAHLLGEACVSMIRVLDVKKIYLGGGISASFPFLYPHLMQVLQQNLTPYYVKDLEVREAILGNRAGILGAASLCISHQAQLAASQNVPR